MPTYSTTNPWSIVYTSNQKVCPSIKLMLLVGPRSSSHLDILSPSPAFRLVIRIELYPSIIPSFTIKFIASAPAPTPCAVCLPSPPSMFRAHRWRRLCVLPLTLYNLGQTLIPANSVHLIGEV